MIVVDSSAVLAVWLAERHADWATEKLTAHAGELAMSTVNLAELLIVIRDRRPDEAAEREATLYSMGVRFVAPDLAQARTAAAARLRFPINFGDCFAYALAVAEDCPILATDMDFGKTDRPVVLPPTAASS